MYIGDSLFAGKYSPLELDRKSCFIFTKYIMPQPYPLNSYLEKDLVDAKREFGWTTAAVTPEVGWEIELQRKTEFRVADKAIEMLLNSLRLYQRQLGTGLRSKEDLEVMDKMERLVSSWRDEQTRLLGNSFGSVFRARYQPSLFAHSLRRYCDLYMRWDLLECVSSLTIRCFGPSNFLFLLLAATLGVFAITRHSIDFILNHPSYCRMKLEAAIQVRFWHTFSFLRVHLIFANSTLLTMTMTKCAPIECCDINDEIFFWLWLLIWFDESVQSCSCV